MGCFYMNQVHVMQSVVRCSKKERFRIRGIQIDNLRGLLGVRRVLWSDEGGGRMIDETVLRWFTHMREWERIGFLKGCMWESVWVFV